MWAKFHDGILDDPRVLCAGEDAANLHLRATIWCCKHETDGKIPRAALCGFTRKPRPEKLATKCVTAGLWMETEAGWQIQDFLDDQPSHAKKQEERRKNRERVEKWRRDKEAQRNAVTNDVTNAVTRALVTPPPSRPDPSRPENLESSPLPPASAGESASPPLVEPIPPTPPAPEPPPEPPPPADPPAAAVQAPRRRRGKVPREPSPAALRVLEAIREETGVKYPPATADALEARLRGEEPALDETQALALVRWAARDRFWGGEVRLRPDTLFRPRHVPGLLAQALADQRRSVREIAPPAPPSPPPPPVDDGTLWGQALRRLRESVSGYAVDSWFAKVRQVGLEGDRLTLAVPNLFVRDWILDHHGNATRRIVGELAGRPLELAFKVITDAGGAVPAPGQLEAVA